MVTGELRQVMFIILPMLLHNPTFSSIDGDLPDMPVFGCIVERDPSTDIIVIGTAYGVYSH